MKRLLVVTLAVMLLAFSCSDEKLPQKETPAIQQIQNFIESAQQKNLSTAELNSRVNTFIRQLGGRPVTEFEMPMSEKTAAKADDCKIGKASNFWLSEDEIVGVLNFSGCKELCPKSGNGYQVMVWTWVNNKWQEQVTYHCEGSNGSFD